MPEDIPGGGKLTTARGGELTSSNLTTLPVIITDAGQNASRFSLVPLMREAADRGLLGGTLYDGMWEDIGTPERLAKLNQE